MARALAADPRLLLLDEIAAHLDAVRRAALFAVLADLGAQTFMTGTDEAAFDPLGDGVAIGRACDGRIELETA